MVVVWWVVLGSNRIPGLYSSYGTGGLRSEV